MPQPFNSAVMTDAGAALLAKCTAGNAKPVYTGMAVGNGTYSATENTKAALKTRTALKSEKNRYAFSSITVENKNYIKLKAEIKNYDASTGKTLVSSGYYINEIGIYAKESGAADSTAVLVSICTTASSTGNGDYMPPYNGSDVTSIIQGYYVTVDDADDVTINTSGAAVLVEDANKITDDTTKQKYQLGIDNGLLYIKEVDE